MDDAFGQFSEGQRRNFETRLSPEEERRFQEWKRAHAPKDSGYDYDFRGAYKSGVTMDAKTRHWPDTYKKPNHPTFSNQSQYYDDAPELAGSWDGDNYVPHRRQGGALPPVPKGAVHDFVNMEHGGFVHSTVPGRTDKHPVLVPSGSYVLTADHVSALGENNTLAGNAEIDKMFGHGGKYGPRMKFATGGGVAQVPVVVAGGERILTPEMVRRYGGGSLEKGMRRLDQWQIDVRKKHIKKLRGLKPPVGSKKKDSEGWPRQ